MPIRVRVADAFAFTGGVAVQVVRDTSVRHILRIGEGLQYRWEEIPDQPIELDPTMTLDDEVARGLLDALLRHYQGASDMHTVRADLLHERGRVDKLTDAVIRIAAKGTA